MRSEQRAPFRKPQQTEARAGRETVYRLYQGIYEGVRPFTAGPARADSHREASGAACQSLTGRNRSNLIRADSGDGQIAPVKEYSARRRERRADSPPKSKGVLSAGERRRLSAEERRRISRQRKVESLKDFEYT